MGEIGVSRREYLFELRFWELAAIAKGYRRRQRSLWEAARLNAFFVMSGMVDLKKGGIQTDRDLCRFAWESDVEVTPPISDEEVERLKKLIREENAGHP